MRGAVTLHIFSINTFIFSYSGYFRILIFSDYIESRTQSKCIASRSMLKISFSVFLLPATGNVVQHFCTSKYYIEFERPAQSTAIQRVYRYRALKSSWATYPISNAAAKSLACDTANEHAITCTRETCSCSETAVQWNQWR